jgi:superfamily I DNA/RNA helicase
MEVCDYADTFAGKEIKPYVKLINDIGPDMLEEMVGASVPVSYADMVISTAHKAKGLEFKSVRVEGDFRFYTDEETGKVEMTPEELRLLYVTLTRAREWLDIYAIQGQLKAMLADAEIIGSREDSLM